MTMKLLLPIILLSACMGRTKDATPVQFKADTTKVLAMLVYKDKSIMHDIIYRIIKDTVGYVKADEETMKISRVRDTSYYVYSIDTVRNPSGEYFKDSTGKFKIMKEWYLWRKDWILIDAGPIDGALKKYQKVK